jgi:hypothetical protein
MQHKHGMPHRWTGRTKLYPVQEPEATDAGTIHDDRQLEMFWIVPIHKAEP